MFDRARKISGENPTFIGCSAIKVLPSFRGRFKGRKNHYGRHDFSSLVSMMRSTRLIETVLACLGAMVWIGQAQAESLSPSLAPGQNFQLGAYKLQTLNPLLQFKEVKPIETYQDAFFLTDQATGAMVFRVPAGAGHTKNSDYPRVELRENASWTMDTQGAARHGEILSLRILSEPKTGTLIFAQIHGEKGKGAEALKMRWDHGDVTMAVKAHDGDKEQRFPLLHGVALGARIDCDMEFQGDTLKVHAASGSSSRTQSFRYAAESWTDIPLYFKAGDYLQDKDRDGSEGRVEIEKLQLIQP